MSKNSIMDMLEKLEDELTCPVTTELFNNPVIICDTDHNFEREEAEDLKACPTCQGELIKPFRPNQLLKNIAEKFKKLKKIAEQQGLAEAKYSPTLDTAIKLLREELTCQISNSNKLMQDPVILCEKWHHASMKEAKHIPDAKCPFCEKPLLKFKIDRALKNCIELFQKLEAAWESTIIPEGCDSYLMYIDEKSGSSTIASSSLKEKEGNEFFTEQLSVLTNCRYQLSLKQSQHQNGQTEKKIERMDWLIAQLEKQQLAASSESKQSPSISTYEEVEVPGNGHCLYNAVGMYVGQDQKQLRKRVADELKLEKHKPFLELKLQQTSEQYIEDVRNGSEWGGDAEITALMHILQRPIIVVNPGENPQVRVQNPTEGEKRYFDKGKPILVKYNGINHYNALILVPRDDSHASSQNQKNILEEKLTQLIKDEKLSHKNAYVYIRSEQDFSRIYIKNGSPQQSTEKIMLKPSSHFDRIESLISQLDNKRSDKNGYLLLTPEAIEIIKSNTSQIKDEIKQEPVTHPAKKGDIKFPTMILITNISKSKLNDQKFFKGQMIKIACAPDNTDSVSMNKFLLNLNNILKVDDYVPTLLPDHSNLDFKGEKHHFIMVEKSESSIRAVLLATSPSVIIIFDPNPTEWLAWFSTITTLSYTSFLPRISNNSITLEEITGTVPTQLEQVELSLLDGRKYGLFLLTLISKLMELSIQTQPVPQGSCIIT